MSLGTVATGRVVVAGGSRARKIGVLSVSVVMVGIDGVAKGCTRSETVTELDETVVALIVSPDGALIIGNQSVGMDVMEFEIGEGGEIFSSCSQVEIAVDGAKRSAGEP